MSIHPDDVPDFLELAENFHGDIRPYPGRGMRSKECPGIISDCDVVEFIYDCGIRGAPCPKTEAMGEMTVFYWPDISWAEWEDARTYHEDTEE